LCAAGVRASPSPKKRLRLGHRHRQHLADVAAAQLVLEDRRVEALALAVLAGRRDAGHHRQVHVDDARAVAGRAGALGVRAEQRRLDAVGLGERLADRLEQPVYVAGLLRRDPRIAAWSTETTPSPGGIEPWMSELLPEPATPGDDAQHAERDVDVDVLQVVRVAPRTSSLPDGSRTVSLSGRGRRGGGR
jgi:hypothetical protein